MVKHALLPLEVLQNIFCYLDYSEQTTLHACTLVSTSWYKCSIALLYHSPSINVRNFDAFIRAVCPSINAHIRTNGLAELVRELDMTHLIHNGSKSLTARLLGRVKGNLEEFVAPQASFAINCLAALSKCAKLRRLDLSWVSESIAISDLLRSTSTLPNLEILHLPRSSAHDSTKDILKFDWPSKLRELHISGGLHDESVLWLSTLPPSVSHLSIGNCPHLSMLSIGPLLTAKGSQLEHLEILAPIPGLNSGMDQEILSNVMELAPNLHHLKISLDFLGPSFFTVPQEDLVPGEGQYLSSLYLDCFEPGACTDVKPEQISDAIVGDGKFSKLRRLGVHRRLGWKDTPTGRQGLEEIHAFLSKLAEEDGRQAEIREADAGVKYFGIR